MTPHTVQIVLLVLAIASVLAAVTLYRCRLSWEKRSVITKAIVIAMEQFDEPYLQEAEKGQFPVVRLRGPDGLHR